ncbi:MAG: hypothetical protein LWY06_17065 [Firmicutes bacterium]|nr:hypothetical protein [Bacillota bacterium]
MAKEEEILPPLTEDEQMWSGLCYPFWFVCSPITLKTDKKNELFLYFHALQGMYFGALTTAASLISFFILYLAFFRNQTVTISDSANPQKVDQMMGCGVVMVLVLAVVLFLLVFAVFMTLYFGWKASNGKMFKLPIIGNIAWQKVYEKKHNLEEEYYLSLTGGKKEEEPEEEPEDPFVSPAAGEGSQSGSLNTQIDFTNLSIKEKDVEKIRSIFAPVEEEPVEEEVVEELPPEEEQEEIMEEEEAPPVVEAPPAKKELTPLEKLAIMRKQQAAAADQQKMMQQFQQTQQTPTDTQSGKTAQMPKQPEKKEPSRDDSIELLKAQSQTGGSKELSPLEKLAAMRRKQERALSGVVEVQKDTMTPAPRATSFLNPDFLSREDQQRIGMTPPGEKQNRPADTIPRAMNTTFLSPLEHLASKQRERSKPEAPQQPEPEKTRRMDSILSGMKEKKSGKISKNTIKITQEDDDEIF